MLGVAGYSGTPLARKLGVTAGAAVLLDGAPADFDLGSADRLGLQIVRSLAQGELRGSIEMRPRAGGGTEAVLVVPLNRRP